MRRACRYVGIPRSTYDYLPRPVPPHQEQLHQRIVALSWAYPRYGYRRIRVLLGREGWMVSRKHVQHIRRQEGLKVRPKPKKIPRRGLSTGLPTQATHRHHVWTWDFIFDRTDKGGTLKMMTLLDEYTRQSLAIQVERQLTASEVLAVLERAMAQYGVPGYIRSDNGPEFIAAKVQQLLSKNQIKTIYIDPGSPWQNGYMATSRASTVVFETNVLVEKCSSIYGKHASLLAIGGCITIKKDPRVNWAIGVQMSL